MRFICIQLFVIFSIFTGGCQRGKLKKNYSLTVTIETEPGNKLFVFYKGENDSIRVDSAIYKNGKFEFLRPTGIGAFRADNTNFF